MVKYIVNCSGIIKVVLKQFFSCPRRLVMPTEVKGEKSTHPVRSRGFLEQLYLDRFDKARFQGLSFSAPDAKATDIIDRYQEIIKDYPPAKLEKEGSIPADLMEALKKLGLFGLNIPEEYGGVGLGLAGYLSVLKAMARTDMALALTPTAHLSIGLKGIILFGNEEQKRKYLSQAATGEMIFAYALTEPGTGSDAQHIQTTATLSEDGTHYILNGQKTYITNGGFAGGLTAFAQMDPDKPGFMGAFIVETAWDGVQVGNEIPKMGLKISSTTPISFKDVKVPVGNLLGQPGDGFKIAMTILNYGRMGLGSASAGAMDQSLEDMFKRATSRKQFGMPIREFELIQEKIVQTAAHSFASTSMTAATASLLEEDHTGSLAVESSHVKLYGTTRAWDTLYEALQTAGGSGYLAAGPYEKRMRDFRVTTVFEGTSEIHSIYPGLYLVRELGKRLKGMGRASQFWYLVKHAYSSPGIKLNFSDPVMGKAADLASELSRSVRKLVHMGALKYGKDIVSREFLLRRITDLSMAGYGLLSALAGIDAMQRSGQDISMKLNLLEYLTQEARETLRSRGQIGDNNLEKAHRRVFADIVAARENAAPPDQGDK
jgi:acyl-CoA dehydrogenase family protein 9